MAPIVDGLIPKYEGKVAIRKYNPDTSEQAVTLAQKYGVQYVPTFVFLTADGTVANTVIGEVPESTLRAELDKLAK